MPKNALVKVQGTQEFMGKQIPVVLGGFGENCKVVTDKMVAEIHNMQTRHVRESINKNIKRFKEHVDFIDLAQRVGEVDTLELLISLGYSKQAITQAEHIYLLSERGYAKLIKIMDTDLAWEIHDKLMDEYFQLREEKFKKDSYMIDDPVERAKVWIKEQEEKKLIELENVKAKKLLEEQEPKVAFANAITASKNSILVRELARLIAQNGIEIGERSLYQWLRENRYVEKNSTKATQKAINLKVLELVERTNQDREGNLHTNFTTYVTPKGQAYFIGKFIERKQMDA